MLTAKTRTDRSAIRRVINVRSASRPTIAAPHSPHAISKTASAKNVWSTDIVRLGHFAARMRSATTLARRTSTARTRANPYVTSARRNVSSVRRTRNAEQHGLSVMARAVGFVSPTWNAPTLQRLSAKTKTSVSVAWGTPTARTRCYPSARAKFASNATATRTAKIPSRPSATRTSASRHSHDLVVTSHLRSGARGGS